MKKELIPKKITILLPIKISMLCERASIFIKIERCILAVFCCFIIACKTDEVSKENEPTFFNNTSDKESSQPSKNINTTDPINNISEDNQQTSLSGVIEKSDTTEEIEEAPALCGQWEEWECVDVGPEGPYGTRKVRIPVNQKYVNTGLYLKAGESVTITLHKDTILKPFDTLWKDGGTQENPWSQIDQQDIHTFLRANISFENSTSHEITSEMIRNKSLSIKIASDVSGILFLLPISIKDFDTTAAMHVTITSNGNTVPSISHRQVRSYAFDKVSSGWVEIYSEHTIFTLPSQTAQRDKEFLERSMDIVDAIYEHHAELRGAVPYKGQRIRFAPIATLNSFMAAGNPVLIQLRTATIDDPTSSISYLGEDGSLVVGAVAHELGHNFANIRGVTHYQIGTLEPQLIKEGSLEYWPDILTWYVLEKLHLPVSLAYLNYSPPTSCHSIEAIQFLSLHPSRISTSGAICFLAVFQNNYGWDFFKHFFDNLNQFQSFADFTEKQPNPNVWVYVYDQFKKAAAKVTSDRPEEEVHQEVTDIFINWGIPIQ